MPSMQDPERILHVMPRALRPGTAYTRDTIQASQTSLRHLLEKQQQLKIQHNQQNDPFSGQLPVEVACRIFGFCIPEMVPSYSYWERYFDQPAAWIADRNVPFHFTLMAVCQSWRRIVWHNPQFWDAIDIRLSASTPISYVSLVAEWIGRSKNLPLAIRISFGRYSELGQIMHGDPRIEHPLFSLVQLIAPRWLHFIAFIPLPIASDRLTHFFASHWSIRYCFTFLGNSPELKKRTFQFLKQDGGATFQGLTRFVHAKLEELTVLDEFAPEIITFLTLPSLRSININLRSMGFEHALGPLIHRLGCRLEEAVIIDAGEGDKDILHFLRPLQALVQLELTEMGNTFLIHLGSTPLPTALIISCPS